MFPVHVSITSTPALVEFNKFYSKTHVPEVLAYREFCRDMRFEFSREFRHPRPGVPQVLRHLRSRRSHDSGPPTTPKQPPAGSQPAVVGAAHLGEA